MTSLQVAQPDALSPLIDWTPTEWDEFIQLTAQPAYQQCKAYYHRRQMRIEAMPTGSDHAEAHSLLILLVGLYCMMKGIPVRSRDACTYRKTGVEEFQPDISYHVGDNANTIPKGTRLVDLEAYPQPDVVVEVSDTTLADDKGSKRLQYEALRIPEYWILDVKMAKILAFSVDTVGRSQQIRTSTVLPDLSFDLIEEALRMSETAEQSAVGSWFMAQIA